MAIGTGTIGLMAAFALIFIPPWVAFRIAKNWKSCLWISFATGVVGYIFTFVIALILDQPFAPLLVIMLAMIAALFPMIDSSAALWRDRN